MDIIDGKIYKITNLVNGKVYIGQTTKTLKRRWTQHCSVKGNYKRNAMACAIRKYGKDKFIIEQIGSATTIEELNQEEVYWIKELNSLAPNGYNLDSGGKNKKPHLQTRLKLSIIGGSTPFDVYKITESIGYHRSFKILKTEYVGTWINKSECAEILKIEHKNICNCLLGKRKVCEGYIFKYKDEDREQKKINELENTKKKNKSKIELKLKDNFFNVYKITKKDIQTGETLEKEYIGTWNSHERCKEKLGLAESFNRVLYGKARHCHGYVFEWCDPIKEQNRLENLKKYIKTIIREFNVYNELENRYIGTWSSKTQCSKDLGLHKSKVGACLLKQRKRHKGYIFEYVEQNND